ncbi:MAG: Smr/MutS family protein [Crocinitomicaceae bacterium]
MFKVGDPVSVIHDAIKGKVLSVKGPKITIEDADGFVRHYKSSDLAIETIKDYNVDTLTASEFIADKQTDILVKGVPARPNKKQSAEIDTNSTEIDLHIEVLFPEAIHWAEGDILQKQMIACRAFVEKAVAFKLKRVILIHGKGEGVLKSEIYRYLNRVQDHLHIEISYHDADFHTFGIGATQVNFKY